MLEEAYLFICLQNAAFQFSPFSEVGSPFGPVLLLDKEVISQECRVLTQLTLPVGFSVQGKRGCRTAFRGF